MLLRPPISTRTYRHLPYTTLFRTNAFWPIAAPAPSPTASATALVRPSRVQSANAPCFLVINASTAGFAWSGKGAAACRPFRSGNRPCEAASQGRSEERRVGKECVSTSKSRGVQDHLKKNKRQPTEEARDD